RGGKCAPIVPPCKSTYSRAGPSCPPARSNTPSTLPTPTQVIVPSRALKEARVMTTPRVSRRASWQRFKSDRTDSCAYSRSVATASCAAAAASSPCPTPSTAATSTPLAKGATRYRSPHTVCPGNDRLATPQSSKGDGLFFLVVKALHPFLHR